VNNIIVRIIPMKIGKPPALGTILCWVWAGCGLVLGLSSILNFLAKAIVGGMEITVSKKEIIGGNKKSILNKIKDYFCKCDCEQ